MSSACTVPRFFRCRVRDFASCFYACRFPLDEEPEIMSNKPDQVSNTKKRREENSVKNSSSDQNGRGTEPRFAEEDYIVFCFRENGEIHMINERKSYDENIIIDEHPNTALRNINREVHCGESVGFNWDSRRGGIINSDEKDIREISISDTKDDENRSKAMENDEKKEINPNLDQENGSKMDSFESCDSDLSDTSTSSFAFPVLGIEWIGSPVHMPKSELDQPRSARLHCCRF